MQRCSRFLGFGSALWLLAVPAPAWTQEEGGEKKTGAAEKKARVALPPPRVKLLEAGKEPRFPIRLEVEKGTTEDLVLAMKMEMAMEVGGNALPATPIPTQELTLRTRVTEVAENGDISYEFTLTKIDVADDDEVPRAQAEMMRSMLASMVGLKGRATVSDRCITRKAELDRKEVANPLLSQVLDGMASSMQNLSYPFPEEPVGTGSKWEVRNELEMQGIRLQQTAVCELALITGSLRKLKITVEQTAAEQVISPPGLPPGAQMKILSMTSQASGEALLDQRRILPRKARLESTSDASMSIKVGDEDQSMRQKLKMVLELKGKTAEQPKAGKD